MWTTFSLTRMRMRASHEPGTDSRASTCIPAQPSARDTTRCQPDAGTQIGGRMKPSSRPRPADVERAALAIEIYPAPIERRLDAERHAHQLARGARQPHRPDRQMQPRRRARSAPRRSTRPARRASCIARSGEEVFAAGRRRRPRRTTGIPPPDRRCRSGGRRRVPDPSIGNRPRAMPRNIFRKRVSPGP